MNVRRWYYENKNRYEEFEVLYDNGRFMLVRNVEGGAFSFGLCEDFGTPFGFPACWSCLTKDQIVEKLNGFIGIDTFKVCDGRQQRDNKHWPFDL